MKTRQVAEWAKALPQIQEEAHRRSQARIPLGIYRQSLIFFIDTLNHVSDIAMQNTIYMPFLQIYVMFNIIYK